VVFCPRLSARSQILKGFLTYFLRVSGWFASQSDPISSSIFHLCFEAKFMGSRLHFFCMSYKTHSFVPDGWSRSRCCRRLRTRVGAGSPGSWGENIPFFQDINFEVINCIGMLLTGLGLYIDGLDKVRKTAVSDDFARSRSRLAALAGL
jgi:hypothetical protein